MNRFSKVKFICFFSPYNLVQKLQFASLKSMQSIGSIIQNLYQSLHSALVHMAENHVMMNITDPFDWVISWYRRWLWWPFNPSFQLGQSSDCSCISRKEHPVYSKNSNQVSSKARTAFNWLVGSLRSRAMNR